MTTLIQKEGSLQPLKPEKAISALSKSSQLLSMCEEEQLYKFYKKGCQKSYNKLFNSHLRLVYKIASKFSKVNISIKEDLISEGMIGLAYAIKKFNPNKGRLCTYSIFWIKYHIEKFYIKNCFGNIAIGNDSNSKKIFYELGKIGKLGSQSINNISDCKIDEISKKLNVNKKLVKIILNRVTNTDKSEIIESLYSNNEEKLNRIDSEEDKKLNNIKNLVKTLKPQHSRIFLARNFESKSLKEISDIEQVSPQRVSYIEKQALKLIKNTIQLKKSEEVLGVL